VQTFRNLERLNVSRTCISDDGMELLAEHMSPCLQTLCIDGNAAISNYGVRFLLKERPQQLTQLSWRNGLCTTASPFKDAFALQNGGHLNFIDLNHSKRIKMLHLDFSKSHRLCAEDTLELILSSCSQLARVTLIIPYLAQLNVSCCPLLETLFVESEQLTKVNSAHCPKLQHVALTSHLLQSLNFFSCRSLNLEALLHVSNGLIASLKAGNLQSLDMQSVSTLTDDHVEQILESLQDNEQAARAFTEFSVANSAEVSDSLQQEITDRFSVPTSNRSQKKLIFKQRQLASKKLKVLLDGKPQF